MNKVRIGFVGLGHRGIYLSKLYQQRIKDCKVVALCDRIKPLVEEGAAQLGDGDISTFTDYSKMLKEADVDAVGVFTDADRQADLICEALYAGKHVTCEVPLAFTIEDCWKIVLAVEQTGLKFQLCEQTRYWPHIRAWREMVKEGKLGKILFVEGQYFHHCDGSYWQDPETGVRYKDSELREGLNVKKTWRNGMPPIIYLPHELSPLLSILDDRVVRVSCMSTRPKSYCLEGVDMPDVQAAIMYTEKDTVMRLACSFTVPRYYPNHWYHIWGTKGVVESNRAEKDKMRMWLADSMKESDSPEELEWKYAPEDMPKEAIGSGHGDADYFPAASFIESIINDTTPPMDVYKSVESAAPAITASISAEQDGKCLEVPNFRPGKKRKADFRPGKKRKAGCAPAG
jgi:predicted dehydrogenase